MIIELDMTLNEFMNKVGQGEKYFYRIDFGEGILLNKKCDNLIFNECMMSIKFLNSTLKNTKFISSNIKTSIFCKSDLTNMVIEDCSVENVIFKSSTLDRVIFNNNHCYNKVLNQDDLSIFIR